MKKGEQPQFSAKLWKSSQPNGLKRADKREDAPKSYEAAKKKLESSGDEYAASGAIGTIETVADAVVSEASKHKKPPEMALTVDVLKKSTGCIGTEDAWIKGHTKTVDESAFADPQGTLNMLQGGAMNIGLVLGKQATGRSRYWTQAGSEEGRSRRPVGSVKDDLVSKVLRQKPCQNFGKKSIDERPVDGKALGLGRKACQVPIRKTMRAALTALSDATR